MLLQYLTISEFLAKNLFDNRNFQFSRACRQTRKLAMENEVYPSD